MRYYVKDCIHVALKKLLAARFVTCEEFVEKASTKNSIPLLTWAGKTLWLGSKRQWICPELKTWSWENFC